MRGKRISLARKQDGKAHAGEASTLSSTWAVRMRKGEAFATAGVNALPRQ